MRPVDHGTDAGETYAYEKMVEKGLQAFLAVAYFPYVCSLHYPEETSLHAGWTEDTQAP